MNASVYSHKELIGTTFLKGGDISMGCVFGEFSPTEYYFEKIQKTVWEFWSSKDRIPEKWDSLRLNVQLENGYFLFPAGGTTIDDFPEFPNEPKRIDIAGIHGNVIEDYFLHHPAKPFLEIPWNDMSIEEKIGLENELIKELGLNAQSESIFKSNQEKHALADFEFSALGRDQRCDDVLFSIRNPNSEIEFAVVHLTWIGKKEQKHYPVTEFYKDFEDFKFTRMYPDKVDFES